MSEANRRSSWMVSIACLLGVATAMSACHHGFPLISSDPAAPVYRNPAADLAKIKGITLHFIGISTSNGEGVDMVQSDFAASAKSQLTPRFGPVTEGTAVPGGGAVRGISVRVNWGSRATRAIVGFGAGKAVIEIEYDLKDATGNLIARMHAQDSMSIGVYGGNAKNLVFVAADKWNKYFADTVLGVQAPQ